MKKVLVIILAGLFLVSCAIMSVCTDDKGNKVECKTTERVKDDVK